MIAKLFMAAIVGMAHVGSSAAQQTCNGYSELCSKAYNQVTTVMTHDSYAYTVNAASTQECPISAQLKDGVRGLKLSAVASSTNGTSTNGQGEIRLCHTSCTILDDGPAVDTLTNLTTWVNSNPNEVLTIMWNNLGNFQVSDFESIYQQSGLDAVSYTQTQGNLTWPTLQEIISSGKRVINFIDAGADQTQVPWLHAEFDYVFETPYNNVAGTSDTFQCTIDRPSDPTNPTSMMYVMNHFLYGQLSLAGLTIQIPQPGEANQTNGDSLANQANNCTTVFGRAPNFLEVDFYDQGSTLSIAAQLNGVTYTAPSQLECTIERSQNPASTSLAPSHHASSTAFFACVLAVLVSVILI